MAHHPGLFFFSGTLQEVGEWDGTTCCRHLGSGDDSCAAIVEMAHVSAQEARDMCRTIKLELQRQRLWEQTSELSPLVTDLLSLIA